MDDIGVVLTNSGYTLIQWSRGLDCGKIRNKKKKKKNDK